MLPISLHKTYTSFLQANLARICLTNLINKKVCKVNREENDANLCFRTAFPEARTGWLYLTYYNHHFHHESRTLMVFCAACYSTPNLKTLTNETQRKDISHFLEISYVASFTNSWNLKLALWKTMRARVCEWVSVYIQELITSIGYEEALYHAVWSCGVKLAMFQTTIFFL